MKAGLIFPSPSKARRSEHLVSPPADTVAKAALYVAMTEAGISNKRVDEVLELVGLTGVARKRPGGFSLGMGQRLGLAGAILADPQVLMLDEPANGLDPQSIQWLRDFLRNYAAQGRSVFVSSHLLSEMQLLADDLVVIARGSLIADETMSEFLARATNNSVLVRSPDVVRLASVLAAKGIEATIAGEGSITVANVTPDFVGEVAFQAGVQLSELVGQKASLEDVFLELTENGQDYQVGGATPAGEATDSQANS
jgi:ABC-2 type transport system ATP-binding protein